MKKNTHNPEQPQEKRPKTDLDEKFISVATQVMKAHGIKSDRAISTELGYRPDFMNRVRNGVQSAPAAAWDALTNKYPEARAVINVTAQGGGQAVGTINGDNYYSPTTLEACQLELEQHKRDLAGLKAKNEQLQQQVVMQTALLESKDALLAAKDETISLLRGSYNRPN